MRHRNSIAPTLRLAKQKGGEQIFLTRRWHFDNGASAARPRRRRSTVFHPILIEKTAQCDR
jgi:hypothetical protein